MITIAIKPYSNSTNTNHFSIVVRWYRRNWYHTILLLSILLSMLLRSNDTSNVDNATAVPILPVLMPHTYYKCQCLSSAISYYSTCRYYCIVLHCRIFEVSLDYSLPVLSDVPIIWRVSTKQYQYYSVATSIPILHVLILPLPVV